MRLINIHNVNKLGIRFVTLGFDSTFGISNVQNVLSDEFINKFLYDFYEIFAQKITPCENITNITLGGATQFTKDRKDKFEALIKNYKLSFQPLCALEKAFKSIEQDEWFYVINPDVYLETIKLDEIYKNISLCNGLPVPEYPDNYRAFLENYDILTYGRGQRMRFGEQNKANRVCRWCNGSVNSNPKATFKCKAHAISEAIGNKGLVLNEECDDCNNFFSKSIEQDLAEYLKIFNVLGGVKGKNGVAKIKKNGLNIENKGNNTISIEFTGNDCFVNLEKQPKISYNSNPIVMQNIYKAFCKFALGVLPADKLRNFDWTRKWLISEENIQKLPVVKQLLSYMFYPDEPLISLHIRKNDDESLPYMFAQLCYKQLIYTYIVPRNREEAERFLDKNVYENYWEQTIYKNVENWIDIDFSDTSRKKVIYNLTFEKASKNDSKEVA